MRIWRWRWRRRRRGEPRYTRGKYGGRSEENRRRRKEADIPGIFISTQNDSFLILNSFRPFDFSFCSSTTTTAAPSTNRLCGRRTSEREKGKAGKDDRQTNSGVNVNFHSLFIELYKFSVIVITSISHARANCRKRRLLFITVISIVHYPNTLLV